MNSKKLTFLNIGVILVLVLTVAYCVTKITQLEKMVAALENNGVTYSNLKENRLDMINTPDDTKGNTNIANFAGQDQSSMNFATVNGDINLTPSSKRVLINGNLFVLENGKAYSLLKNMVGTTSQRPDASMISSGDMYFDITLNQPIWRNKNNNGWVDVNGKEI